MSEEHLKIELNEFLGVIMFLSDGMWFLGKDEFS